LLEGNVNKAKKLLLVTVLLLMSAAVFAAASVNIIITPNALLPGEKGAIRAVLTIPDGMKQSFSPSDPSYFYLQASHPELVFDRVVYPKADKEDGPDEWHYYKKVTLTLPFTVKENARPGTLQVKALLAYNLCFESGMCEPPEEVEKTLVLDIVKTEAEGEEIPALVIRDSTEEIIETEPIAEQEPEPQAETTRPPWTEILKYLVFAFLGGLILNATPCVLPILPIRVMKIINQAKSDDSKVVGHIFLYTMGVLISFGVLAGIFIALQQAGESVGWGLQNQNPGFVIALMSIIFAFALSLLGIFEIQLPGMNAVSQATSKSGYSGSFFGGVFAFLMAIACTGPFLGLALPFALKLPPALMLVFFLIIGLGFAFPFILIGFFKGALKLIPKPGDWMVLFKQFMGFVLLWLVYTQLKTLNMLTDSDYFMKVVWFMLILGFSIWLYGRFVRFEHSKATQWIFTVIPIVLIVSAALVYLPMDEQKAQSQEVVVEGLVPAPHAPQGWYVFSEELLNKTLEEGRPVFLDIGAEWCKNCKTNEKTVLFTDAVMQEFTAKNVLLLRGDFTRKDAKLLAWIKKHERAGVPFNALYIPGQEPILFNELISKGEVSSALNRIPE
jgi:thiol:disulfide interchange protein DsbD